MAMTGTELRPYQQNAIDMVRDEIRKGNRRVLICLPTGSGKSFCMSAIAEGCVKKGNSVLALVHRRQLVTQMVDFFTWNGLSCDTIMAGAECELKSKIQIATIQTYSRRVDLAPLDINHYFVDAQVVMIDEAHHALSKSYQNILKLYSEKIIIGVTATPILSSGVGMGNFFDAIVTPVSVSGLVDDGHLVPGVYYGPSKPDLSKVKVVMGDYQKKQLNEVMNQPKLIGDVVENWIKIADNRQTMVFGVKVSHSKALCRAFNNAGIAAEHLDAHHEDDERNETLDRFKSGKTKVLCNVGLYTEGTDIPEIECIVLARPTKSLGFHLQMVGRGARPYPGKQDFIVIDHGGNVERLGFYEDPVIWHLDGKKIKFPKKQKPREKHKMTCDMCCAVFTGPKCPQCGTEVKDFGKKIDALEAELVNIGKTKKHYTMAEKQKWWAMLEYERMQRGYKPGWTTANYKEKIGHWPREAVDTPIMEPDAEVMGWIKHKRIAWAKRRQNA